MTTLIGRPESRASAAMRCTSRSAWVCVSWRATGKTSPSSSVISTRRVPSASSMMACDHVMRLIPALAFLAVDVDAVSKQPLAAGAVQVLEIGPRHDHAVEQLFHLVRRLRLHVGHLATVAKALRRSGQELPEHRSVPPPQHASQLRYIRRLSRHSALAAPEGLEPPTPALGRRRS